MFCVVKNALVLNILFLFLGILNIITEESDASKFLENIRQKLKSQMLKDKTRKLKRKNESIIHKSKIRKGLIEKLSNPFIRDIRHKTIEIRRGNSQKPIGKSGQWQVDSGQSDDDKEKLTPNHSSLITKVLRDNPALSFKVPDFKKFLKKAISQMPRTNSEKENSNLQSSIDIEYDVYFRAIIAWMEDYAMIPYQFWLMVQYTLIDNEKGKTYFSKHVCKNLTLHKGHATPFFISASGVKNYADKKDALAPLETNPSGPYKTTNKVISADIRDHTKIAKEKINLKSDLCNDFVVLNSQGLLIKELFATLNRCINLFKSNMSSFLSDLNCKKLSNINNTINSIMYLSKKYFKNMQLVIDKKLIPIYMLLYNQQENVGKKDISNAQEEQKNILLLLYYDAAYRKKLLSIENIVFGITRSHLELLEHKYSCKYNIPLNNIYKEAQEYVISIIKSVESSSPDLYDILTNYDALHPISSIMDKLKTTNFTYLFADILSNRSFQNLIKELDNFINNLINNINIKNKSDTLCSSTLLGYIYRYVNDEYSYLTDSQNPIKPYIEGAIFHINQIVKHEYNYTTIELLLENLSYLPISSYLFYTNYYAYIFSKCIIKKDDIDNELKKFVEENKCIFQGKPINCSNNLAMDLLYKFLSKKDLTSRINAMNINRIISDLLKTVKTYANVDIPMGEKFKEICSLFESCSQMSIPRGVCSSIKEYVEKQYTFCPDEFKECTNTAQGNLCYINSSDCEMSQYCLSQEKCTDDTCRKFITNEMDALFRDNIPRKEQFCKILKNDVYNCCNKMGQYYNLAGTVLDICKNGYYRVDSAKATEIYNNFKTFISDNLGSQFLTIIEMRLDKLDKEPFELDDCSKVFK